MLPMIREKVQRSLSAGGFGGIHVFTSSSDIPDDWQLRLVVLPPDASFNRGNQAPAIERAVEILKQRGEQPRQKQNRLLFLVAEHDTVSRLRDQVRSVLAWQSILDDSRDLKLNLDQLALRQAQKSCADSGEALNRMVRETYKWLLAPMQESTAGKGLSEIRWEYFPINPSAANLPQEILRVLKENELLITEWAPIHLAKLLRTWYWKTDAPDAKSQIVWQDSCCYLYMPRLKDETVFRLTIEEGSESRDFFGLAQGKDEGRYAGFTYGKRTGVIMDSSLLLIDPAIAAAYTVEVQV